MVRGDVGATSLIFRALQTCPSSFLKGSLIPRGLCPVKSTATLKMSRKANPCQNEKGKKTLESGGKVVTESRGSPHPCRNRKESRGAGGFVQRLSRKDSVRIQIGVLQKEKGKHMKIDFGDRTPKGVLGELSAGKVWRWMGEGCHSQEVSQSKKRD